ncbi:MAG: STM4013/SEN3800 family hydrolase [Gemmataceae bacterium]
MWTIVGHTSVLFVTLDCLRLDVARHCLAEGRTPNLAAALPAGGWEPRETPGTFTLPAHLAFFHGFLPTPLTPGPHPRLFALEFDGSLTTAPTTFVFRGVDNVLAGFRSLGYRTLCVGGVGFFNKKNPLGHFLPGFFDESVWSPALSVTARDSTANQVRVATGWLETLRADELALLFVNVSATHPPHAMYLPGATSDSVASQSAALQYVDTCLPPLFAALRRRGPCFCLVMADHGEAHGEDGRFGHRIAHPTVTTVPYAHFVLD